MKMIYLVSDMHFYHWGIIPFDNRPYESHIDMNEDLIKRWNSRVNEEDEVYILGDMFFRVGRDKVDKVLDQLNGVKYYIFGNHEKPMRKDVIDKYFKQSFYYLERNFDFGEGIQRVVFSHYPIPMFNGHFRENCIHFYGHVHTSKEQMLTVYQQMMNFEHTNEEGIHNMLNVGVMMRHMDYAPKPLPYLIETAKNKTKELYEYYNEVCGGKMPTIEEFSRQTHLYL